MTKEAMKNLSTYVTYQDFLKLEQAAKEYENAAILKRARKGEYSLFIRLLFFTGARIAEIVGASERTFTQCLFYNKRKGRCPKWVVSRDDKVCLDNKCTHLKQYVQKAHHGIRVNDIVFKDRLIAVYGKNVKSNELKPRTIVIDKETLIIIQEHIKIYN
jgi:integrase/recombinase XerD